MTFADLHIHLLFGVDDGARDADQMHAIVDAAYADGTRVICATPHFHPGYYGDNRDRTLAAFQALKKYAEKYSDLQLFLGNELRYSPNAQSWLKSGDCRTLNDSRYLLVDFSQDAESDFIVNAVLRLMNLGYTPILAHAERYDRFKRDFREIIHLQACGVLIQVDAQSPFGGWGLRAKRRSRVLLEHYFADLVASDAHSIHDRPPQLRSCYDYVAEKCGAEYAQRIFLENPLAVLNNSELRKDMD